MKFGIYEVHADPGACIRENCNPHTHAYLNKIENWWAVLKTWMKQRLFEFGTVRECVDAAFKHCPNVCA